MYIEGGRGKSFRLVLSELVHQRNLAFFSFIVPQRVLVTMSYFFSFHSKIHIDPDSDCPATQYTQLSAYVMTKGGRAVGYTLMWFFPL